MNIVIVGISHLTFSVADLQRSVAFYRDALGARLVARGPRLAYFDLAGIWLALNVETEVPRWEVNPEYTHVAFAIATPDFDAAVARLEQAGTHILSGRARDEREGKSIYFTDPDGHRFELHTGSLDDRLAFYRAARPDVSVLAADGPAACNAQEECHRT